MRWDTMELHRGGMLLMAAISRRHGMPAPAGARDRLQGALFNLWTPDPKHRHHQPNTTHLDPTPRLDALDVASDLTCWDCPNVDQVLWLGTGAIGRVGLWDGDVALALFAHLPLPPHVPLLVCPRRRPGRPRGGAALCAVLHRRGAPVGGDQGRVGQRGGGDQLRHLRRPSMERNLEEKPRCWR